MRWYTLNIYLQQRNWKQILTRSSARDMPAPVGVKRVKHFIGMMNFLSNLCPHLGAVVKIPNISSQGRILSNTGQVPTRSIWHAETDKPWEPLILQYDTLKKGLGVALLQEESVAYVSRALSEPEPGLSPADKTRASSCDIWSGHDSMSMPMDTL